MSMEPWMVVIGGFITAVAGYMAAIARNRTDASIAANSEELKEREHLRSAYIASTDRLSEFYRTELGHCRGQEVLLRAENERLWKELKEAVMAGQEIRQLHEQEVIN